MIEQLSPYIVAYHRKRKGMKHNATFTKFADAVKSTPALLSAAIAEKARLEGKPGDKRKPYIHDAVSKDTHAALVAMIGEAQAEKQANG